MNIPHQRWLKSYWEKKQLMYSSHVIVSWLPRGSWCLLVKDGWGKAFICLWKKDNKWVYIKGYSAMEWQCYMFLVNEKRHWYTKSTNTIHLFSFMWKFILNAHAFCHVVLWFKKRDKWKCLIIIVHL